MGSKTNIAVTGTGSLIGQAIIKSIQRSDLNKHVDIIGFDYFENTVGSFWCKKNILLPDILRPGTPVEVWLETIIKHILENSVSLLFIGVDFELPLFAKNRKYIEQSTGCLVLVSSESAIGIADDKYLTYEFLKNNQLWHPKTFLPSGTTSLPLDFPFILKPRKGARSVGVHKIKNEDEYKLALSNAKEPILQELIGDDSTEFTCGVIMLNGELKRSIALQRSLKAGNTYLSTYRKDFPEIIYDYISSVASILQPNGACNFQLRIDAAGLPKIFEINCRHSGTTYIRSLFGFLEVEYIINYLLFKKDTEFTLREGTTVRYYDEFFVSN